MKKIVFLNIFLLIAYMVNAQQNSITAAEAKDYIGKKVQVCDMISQAILPSIAKDEPTVLYIGNSYNNRTLALIFTKKVLHKFSYDPDKKMVNQKFCAKGKLSMYEGKPGMYIKSEAQILNIN